jgi:hypothetical protein
MFCLSSILFLSFYIFSWKLSPAKEINNFQLNLEKYQ